MQHEPRRFPNPGFAPTKWPEDTQLHVEFRNGTTGQYLAKQLRWKPWDWCGEHPGDVVRFWRA